MSANENNLKPVAATDLQAAMEAGRDAKSFRNSEGRPDDSAENKSEQSPEKPALSVKDLKTAYVYYLVNQRKELQSIAKQLAETVEQLKNLARRKPESLDNLIHLGEQVKDGNILLNEIKDKMSEEDSGKEYLHLEACKRREHQIIGAKTSSDGVNNNLEKTGDSVTPQTKTDSEEQDGTSDKEQMDKRQMELAFVKTIVQAAEIRQRMAGEDTVKELKDKVKENDGMCLLSTNEQKPAPDSSSNDPPALESVQNITSATEKILEQNSSS